MTEQGNLVRKLKSEKAEKSVVEGAVKKLLELKAEYKLKNGKDYKPASGGGATRDGGAKQPKQQKQPKKEKPVAQPAKGQTKLGLQENRMIF